MLQQIVEAVEAHANQSADELRRRVVRFQFDNTCRCAMCIHYERYDKWRSRSISWDFDDEIDILRVRAVMERSLSEMYYYISSAHPSGIYDHGIITLERSCRNPKWINLRETIRVTYGRPVVRERYKKNRKKAATPTLKSEPRPRPYDQPAAFYVYVKDHRIDAESKTVLAAYGDRVSNILNKAGIRAPSYPEKIYRTTDAGYVHLQMWDKVKTFDYISITDKAFTVVEHLPGND